MAALAFHVIANPQDHGGVEVLKRQGRGLLARCLLDQGQEQTQGSAGARHGLRTHPLVVAQVLGKAGRHMGSNQRLTSQPAIPPAVA